MVSRCNRGWGKVSALICPSFSPDSPLWPRAGLQIIMVQIIGPMRHPIVGMPGTRRPLGCLTAPPPMAGSWQAKVVVAIDLLLWADLRAAVATVLLQACAQPNGKRGVTPPLHQSTVMIIHYMDHTSQVHYTNTHGVHACTHTHVSSHPHHIDDACWW